MSAIHKLLSMGSSLKTACFSSRKSKIISASAVFFAVCAFGAAGVAPIAPDAADLPVKLLAGGGARPGRAGRGAARGPAGRGGGGGGRGRPGGGRAGRRARRG